NIDGAGNVVDQESVTNIVTGAGGAASVVQSSSQTTNVASPGISTLDSVSTSVGANNLAAFNAVSTLTSVGGGLNVVNQQSLTNIVTSAGNLASVVQSSTATSNMAWPGILATESSSISVGGSEPVTSNAVSTLTSFSGGLNFLDQHSLTNIASSAGNLASVVQSSSEIATYAWPGILATDSSAISVGGSDLATSNAVSTFASVSGGGLNFVDQQSATNIFTSAGNPASLVQSSSLTVIQTNGNINSPLAAGVDALMADEAMVEEAAIAMFWAA
ncbi:MAG TPA: hypothetical protein VGX78_18485, partial [Pirellulales bacterium]|nr:hypothetical protein [Pirellulales bacterium]